MFEYKYAIQHTRAEDLNAGKDIKIAIVTYHSSSDRQKDASVGHRESIKAIRAVYSRPFVRLCGMCTGRNLKEDEEIVTEVEVLSDSLKDVVTQRIEDDAETAGMFCPPAREESSCHEAGPSHHHFA